MIFSRQRRYHNVCMYVWVYSSSNDGTGYKVIMIVEFFYSGGEGYLQ